MGERNHLEALERGCRASSMPDELKSCLRWQERCKYLKILVEYVGMMPILLRISPRPKR